MIFAYFGPETSLPVVSTIATVTGLALMTGRVVYSWFARKFRSPGRR